MNSEVAIVIASAFGVGLLSTFCSLAESSIVALNDFKVRNLVKEDVKGAKELEMVINDRSKFLSSIIMLNTIVNIGGSMLVGSLAANAMSESKYGLFVFIMTVMMLLFSEIKPKVLAAQNPEKIGRVIVYPIKAVTWFLTPVVNAINGFLNNGSHKEESMTLTEIEQYIYNARDIGIIRQDEKKLVMNVFNLRSKKASSIVADRKEIVSTKVSNIIAKEKELILSSKHRRIVLLNKNDKPVGVALKQDALATMVNGEERATFADIMHPLPVIDSDCPLADLAIRLENSPTHMAAVAKKDTGELLGVIGLSDIQGLLFS